MSGANNETGPPPNEDTIWPLFYDTDSDKDTESVEVVDNGDPMDIDEPGELDTEYVSDTRAKLNQVLSRIDKVAKQVREKAIGRLGFGTESYDIGQDIRIAAVKWNDQRGRGNIKWIKEEASRKAVDREDPRDPRDQSKLLWLMRAFLITIKELKERNPEMSFEELRYKHYKEKVYQVTDDIAEAIDSNMGEHESQGQSTSARPVRQYGPGGVKP
ncbi:MAG: hypothetical protein Q9227_004646 [Pyrenula ochraceoflavens]